MAQRQQKWKTENRSRMNPSCPQWPPSFRQRNHRDWGISILILVWGLPENSDARESREEKPLCWLHPENARQSPPKPGHGASYRIAVPGGSRVLHEQKRCVSTNLRGPGRYRWVGLGSPGECHSPQAATAQIQIIAVMGEPGVTWGYLVSLEEPDLPTRFLCGSIRF